MHLDNKKDICRYRSLLSYLRFHTHFLRGGDRATFSPRWELSVRGRILTFRFTRTSRFTISYWVAFSFPHFFFHQFIHFEACMFQHAVGILLTRENAFGARLRQGGFVKLERLDVFIILCSPNEDFGASKNIRARQLVSTFYHF